METTLNIKTNKEFNKEALNLFRKQSVECKPYCDYLSHIGVDPKSIKSVEEIPFMPIEFFKTHRLYGGVGEPEMIFTSSSTTGQTPSKHYLAYLSDYEVVFRRAFSLFYHSPAKWSFYALLPSYLERKGSSLIYMMDDFIKSGGGGFYLYDHQKLINDIRKDPKPKILFGVTYALLDLVNEKLPKLSNFVVMETGGMKGQREELPKEEIHKILSEGFDVPTIHSEYGMAELTSQAYSYGGGEFMTPPWMKILVRDINDPLKILSEGKSGGINIIDLANKYSCAFIQTEDIGVVNGVKEQKSKEREFGVFESTYFSILGRIDKSETRGCNLLIQ